MNKNEKSFFFSCTKSKVSVYFRGIGNKKRFDVMKIERNYGVDLLRILAMYMVVVLHVLGKGGILYSLEKMSISYEVAWFLEICAYCAVNCYALISGYVGIKSRFKLSSILLLWLQVAFYTVLITVAFKVFMPDVVSVKHIIRAFFPATFKQYWYFTAYVILFFIAPFINAGIQAMKKEYIKILLILMTILFSFIPLFTTKDYFMLENGYSSLWLIYLYVLGGYIGKYGMFNKLSKLGLLSMYFSSVVLTWGSKFVIEYFSLNVVHGSRILVSYISPTILLSAISLLVLFSKLEVKGLFIKIVQIFSPATFGVYLIHTHPLFWVHIWANSFKSFISFPPLKLMLSVLIISAFIYVLLSFVDILRSQLFNLLKIKNKVTKLEQCILNKLSKEIGV